MKSLTALEVQKQAKSIDESDFFVKNLLQVGLGAEMAPIACESL